ncbi:hypothetical protein SPRG_03074 [Saprolegnia parasitica CBS 223.65]|uniref:subtilisin n=1 Tax=Saprolegnia parasitica (strain CBS 223.65) TaxID=695850 RepID=A0A067D1G6_SAPPC|nr:hypothetical protein SPRG_03074 [Saprolegnia parasitica CBS 223.65]KDO32601.1 hypothetical protein SPRG_03074 [Saprolegnia parasitica CBS 223.65]|eukprot:XP_012197045.1 hypothetical protein SPRG_03074 [Saprolegnia parasitica CBS 223.65]
MRALWLSWVTTVAALHHGGWTRLGRADSGASLDLRFALRPAQPDALAAQLAAISDVHSPAFGKYMSSTDLRDLVAPSVAALTALDALLDGFNATTTGHGDYVRVTLPVAAAEDLFATELHEYKRGDRRVVRPFGAYAVPASIRDHVLLVDGLEHFPTAFRRQSATRTTASIDGGISISAIQQQYGLPTDRAATDVRNRLVVGAFLKEAYRASDLRSYYARNHVASSALPKSVQCTGNGGDDAPATGEASLDVQLVMGLTANAETSVFCYNSYRDATRPFSDDNQEPFVTFMHDINAMEPAPSVVSISYADDECAVPPAYIAALDAEFIKAGLRGTTVVVASGDNGVVGSTLISFCGRSTCARFETGYPASSPYVLSVGGTQLLEDVEDDGKHRQEEVVSTDTNGAITSGSGFSWYASRPSYQDNVVQAYNLKENLDESTAMYNGDGRVFPDVVAIGHNVPIVVDNMVEWTDGTSASAPIVAALLNQVNKDRLLRNLPLLGFVNPYLYKLFDVCPHIFRDISVGNNKCGGHGQDCCDSGFSAGSGWDPLTGLGAIQYDRFVEDMIACEARMHEKAPLVLVSSGERGDVTLYVAGGVVLLATGLALLTMRGRRPVMEDSIHLGYKLVD